MLIYLYLNQKIASINNQNYQGNMLIRHISIPKNSYLVSLKQPKQIEDIGESKDLSNMISRTLNPQQPSRDSPLINIDIRNIKSKSLNRTENPIKKQTVLFGRESPILYHQYLSNKDISPKKQWTKFDSYEQIKNERLGLNEIYKNPHCLSNYTPSLSKNAYLIKPQQNQHKSQVDLNMFHYNRDPQGEIQQELGLNKHQSGITKNSELYKTLQKFKSKRLNEGGFENNLNMNKKYAYSLPKHMSSQPQKNHKESQLSEQDPVIQKKKFRSKQLNMTPNANLSNIIERKKKILPKENPFQIQSKTINPLIKNEQKYRDNKQQLNISGFFNKKQKSQIKNIQRPQKVTKYFENTQPSQAIIEISYRTSLAKLKQICCTQSLDKHIVTMKIPEIFAYPMFSGNEEQAQLFNKAEDILRNLQVQFKTDIQLKKYTNCITIIVNRIAIIWHFTGKVYFGGWKNQMFDQGCKEGLGLQWSPKKYVYYGQYHKNKRSGIGIMKNNENEIMSGIWRDNHYIRNLLNNEEQLQNKLFSIIK